MALTPGTRLGVFELADLLGRGGMGEVYRATDTKLKRQVAIKVLPPSMVADRDRLARFQREAEVLASLNHPNIAAIYGLEESEGITALVMELVEGDDLSERIARGAIPLDEALPIAKQIAEALEAAHERGIIHRDLKPANIKVRSDGTVKVLDFGLAKAIERAGEAGQAGRAGGATVVYRPDLPDRPGLPDLSASPTLTSPAMLTGAGMILGTAAYMSPEQARGKTVDRRTDIWAFGVVLFEMLTGTKAFAADDVSLTLARVLERDPDFDALPPSVPARITQALRLCLRKDPKQRVGDIRDVRLALDGAFETAAPQTTVASASATAPRGRLAWMVAAAAALVAAAMTLPAVRYLRETPPPAPPETRVDIVTPPTNSPGSFALSPDGRKIAYVATTDGVSRLWVRPLDSISGQALPGTENASLPFWSPDSRSLGFFADDKLKRIDLGGGQPQNLAGVATTTAAQGAWGAEGTILFNTSLVGPLLRIPAAGGQAVAATNGVSSQQRSPHFLMTDKAGGKQFLFTSGIGGTAPAMWLGTLDGGRESRRVTELGPGESGGQYLAPGWLVRVRGTVLVAQRFDTSSGQLSGDPVTLAEEVGAFSVAAAASLGSGEGRSGQGATIAWRSGAGGRKLIWFNRAGQNVGVLGAPDDPTFWPEISADGKRVAFARGPLGSREIWIQEGTRTSRLTFNPADDQTPIWSPDGVRVVFRSGKGTQDLYQKAADASGSEELLLQSGDSKSPESWSPDGRFILYVSLQNNGDLMVLPMTAGADRKPYPFLGTPFDERQGVFAPDGKWVAYQSNESGRVEIYVRRFRGRADSGRSRRRVGTVRGGGRMARLARPPARMSFTTLRRITS